MRGPWIGLTFFFSFELSYWSAPEARSGACSRGRWSGLTKKFLQSPPSLCRMVAVVLSDSPRHHNQIGQRLAV